MLKNISNLGQILSKTEQLSINGGRTVYCKVKVCSDEVVTTEDMPGEWDDDVNCHYEWRAC